MTATQDILSLLSSAHETHVLCIGDMILDQFVYGDTTRISPEAPVPVLKIKTRQYTLGGVGNVVANIAALGAKASVISLIGEDASADKINEMLAYFPNVINASATHATRATCFKTRYIASSQQVLRADEEDASPVDEATEDAIIHNITHAIETADLLVLSDYGKGVLTERVIRAAIQAAGRRDIPVLVDPKGTDYTRYRGADIVTPNRNELKAATNGLPTDSDADVETAARQLMDETGIPTIIATRSADGVSIIHSNHPAIHMPTHARAVYDVSGAGDTFVAGLSVALGAGAELSLAAELANIAAGLAVEKLGTAIVRAADVRHYLDAKGLYTTIMSLEQAREQIERWHAAGLKVGFTNGCFDILHKGHVMMLDACRGLCDRLIVGVNVDESVRRLKGATRPVNDEDARALVIAGLGSVDGVVLFGADTSENDTPLNTIKSLRPDMIFKGQDYTVETVVGAEFVMSYGGTVELIPLQHGYSTTNTIKKMSA